MEGGWNWYEPEQETPAFCCETCGGEIYREGAVFLWRGEAVCRECFAAEAAEWIREEPEMAALLLGCTIKEGRE